MTPTIEDIKRLVEREYPGYEVDAGSKMEVRDGNVTTYRGVLPPDIQQALDDIVAEQDEEGSR